MDFETRPQHTGDMIEDLTNKVLNDQSLLLNAYYGQKATDLSVYQLKCEIIDAKLQFLRETRPELCMDCANFVEDSIETSMGVCMCGANVLDVSDDDTFVLQLHSVMAANGSCIHGLKRGVLGNG